MKVPVKRRGTRVVVVEAAELPGEEEGGGQCRTPFM